MIRYLYIIYHRYILYLFLITVNNIIVIESICIKSNNLTDDRQFSIRKVKNADRYRFIGNSEELKKITKVNN